MKSAAEMYPEHAADQERDGSFCGPCDYTPIIEALGEVVLRKDDSDYQGDTYALVKGADGRLGYVNIGWGSCSGCDALQACDTLADIDKLAQSIADGAKWFADEAEARAWFEGHDWQGEYGWRNEERVAFVRETWAFLKCAGDPPEPRE
jgi:hypothetical protein